MRFFVSFSILCELSNECFSVLNGIVVWENFGFEGIMVITRVSCDVIKVFS